MGRRALLAVFVVLLLIGAYGAYAVSYPKYPEGKGPVRHHVPYLEPHVRVYSSCMSPLC